MDCGSGSPGCGCGSLGCLVFAGLVVSVEPGSIPGPRAGARVACACPITEQLRIEDKTMGFMAEVTGDAFDAMVDAWGDVDSFTRAELGGAPEWAEYVDDSGELFNQGELEYAFENDLNECYDTVSVCGYEFGAGRALRELDPIAFRCDFNDWIDGRISDGELRRIED